MELSTLKSDIKFVATHLLAAYESRKANDAQVYATSQFTQVEDFILEKVRNDGRFLRIKNFADAVAVPMCDIVLKVYEHSAAALLESDIWLDKRVRLSEWRKEFLERSQKRFKELYQELSDRLDSAIDNFAEHYYEDENVNENWTRTFQSLHFDEEYQKFLTELANECARKRKELSDELKKELKFSFGGMSSTNITLEGTTTWGQYGSALLSSLGDYIERYLIDAIPPLVIAIAVIGALGFIFSKSKDEKIRKAKAKLSKDLQVPSFEAFRKTHDKVIAIFNEKILREGIDEFGDMLANYQFMFARLGKSQKDMAEKLSDEYIQLNAILVDKAINYTNAGRVSECDAIIRVPGERTLLLAENSTLNNNALTALLGEKFVTLRPKKELSDTLEMLLKCGITINSYHLELDTEEKEAEQTLAVFPKGKVDFTDFKLAQQIAGVPIVAEFNQPPQNTSPSKSNAPNSNQNNRQEISFKSAFSKIEELRLQLLSKN